MNEHIEHTLTEVRSRILSLQDLEQRIIALFGAPATPGVEASTPTRRDAGDSKLQTPRKVQGASPKAPSPKSGLKVLRNVPGTKLTPIQFGNLLRGAIVASRGAFSRKTLALAVDRPQDEKRIEWSLAAWKKAGELMLHERGRMGSPATYVKTNAFRPRIGPAAADEGGNENPTEASRKLLEEIKNKERAKSRTQSGDE